MAEWRNGRMTEWRSGGMAEWQNGRVAYCTVRNSTKSRYGKYTDASLGKPLLACTTRKKLINDPYPLSGPWEEYMLRIYLAFSLQTLFRVTYLLLG
jgi:hypothetical protein